MTIAERTALKLRNAVVSMVEDAIRDPAALVGKRGSTESRDHWAARAVVKTMTGPHDEGVR